MTQEWVNQKNQEHEEKIAAIRSKIVDFIKSLEKATDDDKKSLMEWFEIEEKRSYPMFDFAWFKFYNYYCDENVDKFNELKKDTEIFNDYENALRCPNMYSRYVDSTPMHFDGDIVITDPCYIIKHRDQSTRPKWSDYMRRDSYQGMSQEELVLVGYYEDHKRLDEAQRKWDEENPDDWNLCDYGNNMNILGLTTWMTRDTLYGDWSCTTFNSDTKESIGGFCADAGLVSVFLLKEIMEYNPDFYTHHLEERDWTATLIRDFVGDVQFVIERETGVYEEDTKWWKAGDTWEEFVVRVVGHGVNKVTGVPINFITSQTGL